MNKSYFLIFVFAIMLIFARGYEFLVFPRLWAEEGIFYLQNAFDKSSFEHIFAFTFAGYYSFFVNIITFFASNVDYQYIPFVTTYSSLFMLLALIIIILYSNIKYLENKEKFFLILFIIVCSPTEIWLNTVNVQFYLPIMTLFIILDQTSVGIIKKYSYRVLLIINFLTGFTSIILTPLLLYKYILEKNKEKLLYLFFSIVALIIHISFYFTENASRQINLELIDIQLIMNNILYPLFGADIYLNQNLLIFLQESTNKELIILLISALVIGLIFFIRNFKTQVHDWIIIFASYLLISLFIAIGSLNVGMRYGFTSFIFLVLLFLLVANSKKNVYIYIFIFALLINQTYSTYNGTANKLINNFKNWSSFENELANCNGQYPCKIKIFPQWSEESFIILKSGGNS